LTETVDGCNVQSIQNTPHVDSVRRAQRAYNIDIKRERTHDARTKIRRTFKVLRE